MRDTINWVRLLAFVTGSSIGSSLLRNELLVAEDHILRARQPARVQLSDPDADRCDVRPGLR